MRRGGIGSSWITPFLLVLLVAAGGRAAAEQTVRVGVYDNPPKVSVDEAGMVSGFYPALLERIASEEG